MGTVTQGPMFGTWDAGMQGLGCEETCMGTWDWGTVRWGREIKDMGTWNWGCGDARLRTWGHGIGDVGTRD